MRVEHKEIYTYNLQSKSIRLFLTSVIKTFRKLTSLELKYIRYIICDHKDNFGFKVMAVV